MKEYLRDAADTDRDLLFAWANEKEVRRNSFSKKQITYEEHSRWFLKIMQDDAYRQYIYMVGQVPAGQVRLQITGDTAEISYSISAGYRGKGHGKKMLDCLREQVVRQEPQIRTLTARVKTGNDKSKRVFLNMGFSDKYELFELELDRKQCTWTDQNTQK